MKKINNLGKDIEATGMFMQHQGPQYSEVRKKRNIRLETGAGGRPVRAL